MRQSSCLCDPGVKRPAPSALFCLGLLSCSTCPGRPSRERAPASGRPGNQPSCHEPSGNHRPDGQADCSGPGRAAGLRRNVVIAARKGFFAWTWKPDIMMSGGLERGGGDGGAHSRSYRESSRILTEIPRSCTPVQGCLGASPTAKPCVHECMYA